MWKSWIASLTRWLDGRGWKDAASPEVSQWQASPPMPVIEHAPAPVSEAVVLANGRRRVADAFDAAHPVRTRTDLFGREKELNQLLTAVLDFHQHAVIHGARGSGKTSLVRVLGEHADESGAVVLYFACEPHTTFSDLLNPYLHALPSSAFAPGGMRAFAEKLEQLPGDFGPRTFVDLVADRIVVPTILIFDEFDRIEDMALKGNIAAAMKLLSDALVPIVFVLVGIARSVSDIVDGHPSLRRHMRIVPIGRISADSVAALITRGEENAGVRFDVEARAMIVRASCGSPYHLRVLAGSASLAAVVQGSDTVTKGYARAGFVDAFGHWSQMNEPDARLFAKIVVGSDADQCAGLEALARAAAMTDIVVLDSERLSRAAAAIAPALVHEEGTSGEPSTIYFRDSTAPQMLIALLMTTPIYTTTAPLAQESDFANTR